MKKNRWYDQYPSFSEQLERLKYLTIEQRESVLEPIHHLLEKTEPGIIEQHVKKFPLSMHKRRWYDKDPYSWMIINALRFAKSEILDEVTLIIEKRLKEMQLT